MVAYGIRNHFIDRDLIETDRGWFNGLLAGTQIHLWFLPYIFAVSVALDFLVPRANLAWLGRSCALASVALLGTISLWWPWAVSHGYPTQQYCHAVAALLIGVFLACAPRVGRGWLLVLLAAVLGTALVQLQGNRQFVGAPYLTGAGLCAWVLLKPPSLPDWLDVTPISQCTFGIYLSHVFFRDLYESIERVPEWSEPYLTFATALLAVYLFRRFLPRPARWAV
jgi:surface polysaccharide O-acyltransferase-like enzyme